MATRWRTDRNREHMRVYDAYAHATTVIQEQHRLIHDGMMFHASGRAVDVGVGANYDVLINVPAGLYPHMQKLLWTLESGPCDLKVYEGATTSADGTTITAFNLNRISSITPDLVGTHTPTVTGVGTLIHDRYVATAGKDTGLVAVTAGEEWILQPDTKYLIRLTNNTGSILDLGFEMSWYELSYEE
jgi:hypothetical protein